MHVVQNLLAYHVFLIDYHILHLHNKFIIMIAVAVAVAFADDVFVIMRD